MSSPPSQPAPADRAGPLAVLVVGAGFGGLGMAMKLKAAGIEDFLVLDKNPEVGGTWYENTYPGAACDVESHLYSYSFLRNPAWSRKYAGQAEIQRYLAACAAERGLAPHLRLGTEVVEARFDEPRGLWRVTTADGARIEAKVLVAACGQLNRPAMPTISGLADFAGPSFHSARWARDFDPAGKVVAVIGTGASAVQIVPELAASAARVLLFQRSGAWVLPKGDRAFTTLERRLASRLPLAPRLYRATLAARNEARGLAFVRHPWMLAAMAWRVRRVLARQIRDPQKRRALLPNYRLGCKRILLSDDWYPALDRDTVELVPQAIRRAEPGGLVTAEGRAHPADALIFATGFQAANPLESLNVAGRGGLVLNEVWRRGPSAYKGISIAGFPNLFLIYGPHTNLGHDSIVAMLEAQADYVVAAIRHLAAGRIRGLDVKPAAADAFDRLMDQRMRRTIWNASCSSWYRGPDGRVTSNWPGLVSEYRALVRRFEPADHDPV